jgi:hypothetical protein
MKKIFAIGFIFVALVFTAFGFWLDSQNQVAKKRVVTDMILDHARAWESGDEELLASLLHDDVIFAYPGRRLDKEGTLEDLRYFRDNFTDTKVYINTIVIDGDDLAVEWQFATTKVDTGERQVVSDAIIGKMQDRKFIVWKEYLDGRVKLLQAEGLLEYEEGMEPFPWPNKIEIRAL